MTFQPLGYTEKVLEIMDATQISCIKNDKRIDKLMPFTE